MKKVISPDINQYLDLLSYLQDFYLLNKKKNAFFSFRYLASKIGWSAPYINDVFKGRKKFSLARAIEFINFIELKGTKAERFLFLYLSDTDHAFATSALKETALSNRDAKRSRGEMDLEEFKKLSSLFDYYILYYIELNCGIWDTEDFIKKLTLPCKPKVELIEQSLKRLQVIGQIKFNSKTKLYKIPPTVGNVLIIDQEGKSNTEKEKIKLDAILKQEREYQTNYLNYLQHPVPNRRTFFSGILNLDLELYNEAQDRISALRNYLYELDVLGQQRYSEASGPESRIWQFSMNIFSLFENNHS